MKVQRSRDGLTICHSILCGVEGKREEGTSGWKKLVAKEIGSSSHVRSCGPSSAGPACNFLTMMDDAQRAIRTVDSYTFHTLTQDQPIQLISKCLSFSVPVVPSPLRQRRLPLLRPKLTWSRTCTTGIQHLTVHCHTDVAC